MLGLRGICLRRSMSAVPRDVCRLYNTLQTYGLGVIRTGEFLVDDVACTAVPVPADPSLTYGQVDADLRAQALRAAYARAGFAPEVPAAPAAAEVYHTHPAQMHPPTWDPSLDALMLGVAA